MKNLNMGEFVMRKIILFILMVLILSGCNNTTNKQANTSTANKPSNTSTTNKPSNSNTKLFNSQIFIQSLKDIGYTVTKGETGNWTLLSVNPTYYTVDDKHLSIYEYKNDKEAINVSKNISKDGFAANVDWVDIPHFYQKGEIIVGYIGSDTKFLIDLGKILGKSIINS